MRISGLRAYPLRVKLAERFCYSQKWVTHRTALLVKVTTDEGIHGWGEVFCHDAPWALAALLEKSFQPLLIGRNPLAVGVVWDFLYNWTKDYGQRGLTAAAISGIDIALWDILGKVTQQPVCTLLGGAFRTRVQAYATGLYGTDAPDQPVRLAEEARGYAEKGFKAIKMKIGFGVAEDLRRVRAVREAIDPAVQLMVDANHAYDARTALQLGRALEPYNIGWFEEPVSPEDLEGYRRLRDGLNIPVAGGEAEFTRFGFRDLITRGAVDIVQPDICICGGLSEAKKIADLARTWHIRCLPHVWGTAVGLAASLHFMAALPDTPPSLNPQPLLVELDQTDHPLRHVTRESIAVEDNWVRVPLDPGLGVEVDEGRLAHHAAAP
jgi:D-galactarolactone cycloisomerase